MWQLDHKKVWVPTNWCFLTAVLERRLLRVPWTVRTSNQSILKETNPEYSLEGPMVKLKLQYFGYLMQRTDSFEQTLMLGKIVGGRRSGWHRMRLLDGITGWWTWIWASSGSLWWTGKPGVLQSMGSEIVRHDWVTELNCRKDCGKDKLFSEELRQCFHIQFCKTFPQHIIGPRFQLT